MTKKTLTIMSNKPIYAIWGCLAVYLWYVLAIDNHDLLYIIQDFSPWLGTKGYFEQSITHPGGLREYMGDFVAQLFYYPVLGATMLVCLWALSVACLVKGFRLEGPSGFLAALPVLALLASMTQLGYQLFCLKAPGYWVGPTLGLLAVSLVVLAYSMVRVAIRPLVLLAWIAVGYPVLGWYATLGAALLLIMTSFPTRKYAFCMLLCAVLPFVALYLLYHGTTGIHWHDSFLMYGFHHITINKTSVVFFEVVFYILAASLILLAVLSRMSGGWMKSKVTAVAVGIIIIGAVAGTRMMNYRNPNFRKELVMLRAMENGSWDAILTEMADLTRKPTRQMVLMKNVALAQMGRLGSDAFSYDSRGVRPRMNVELPIHMAHSAAPYFYYWLGLPNYAFMWCMENNVEYGLSPYFLKLMYRCALANNEKALALKYRKLLSGYLFYQDFSVSASELKAVAMFHTNHDELTNDRGYSEAYLMQRLSGEQYSHAKPQQLAVFYAMLKRDGKAFARATAVLDSLTHGAPLPKHFVEAQAVFAEKGFVAQPEGDVQKAFDTYCLKLENLIRNGASREDIAMALYPEYGNTYWWFYDFNIDNKTY